VRKQQVKYKVNKIKNKDEGDSCDLIKTVRRKMKINFCISLFALLLFTVSACSTGTVANSENSPQLKRSSAYYEGKGGKGIRLTVLPPGSKGIDKNNAWLPLFVQGTLTNNLNIFSAMTVLDRQNLDKILSEQALSATGIFSEKDAVRIGNLTNAQYILSGTLIKISETVLSLQLAVSETETGERKASFLKNCTPDDIKNISVLNEATEQLLAELGVNLTKKGRQVLFQSRLSTAAAETALSKGIAAQKQGTAVEAISYYYEAIRYNPALSEATKRLSVLSTNIKSGNIGASVRSDIERREAWLALMRDCEQFIGRHLPYEIEYSTDLKQSNVSYSQKTVDLSFAIASYPTGGLAIVNDILAGLKKTGKKEEWGFQEWPLTSPAIAASGKIAIAASLINEKGQIIATSKGYLHNKVKFGIDILTTSAFACCGILTLPLGGVTLFFSKEGRDPMFYDRSPYKIKADDSESTIVFSGVDAYKITDKLTIKIISVDGIDAQTAAQSGYVKISAKKK
jgi:hypothetical protein